MSSYTVQLQRLSTVPRAVVRRQVSLAELSRVIPDCCGLVWNEVRAQQTQAGRNVAVYWDDSIRLEVGMELLGPFAERGRSYARQHPRARRRRRRISDLIGASAPRTRPIAGGAARTITTSRGQIGRSTVTGSASGMPIRRRFARMSTTNWRFRGNAPSLFLRECLGVFRYNEMLFFRVKITYGDGLNPLLRRTRPGL